MPAEPQTALDRSHAVLVEGGHFSGALRKVVVGLLFRSQRSTLEKRHGLVEDSGITGRGHVPARSVDQPQIIVRRMRPDAVAFRWVPPVLHVALTELPFG